jgi:hypothetical protein
MADLDTDVVEAARHKAERLRRMGFLGEAAEFDDLAWRLDSRDLPDPPITTARNLR